MHTRHDVTRSVTQSLLIAAIVIGAPELALAGLLGSGFSDGKLYDISTVNGAATNPRNLGTAWSICYSPGGTLYGVTQSGGTPTANTLFTVNVSNGASTTVATTTPVIGTEGDIAFDPTSGKLYAVDGTGVLFTINTSNGVGTVIGSVLGVQDFSAMAFDSLGNLYCVDTAATTLVHVNKANAAVINTVNLVPPPNGGVAGMAIDPMSGIAYIASGLGTTNNLYTVNTTTGAMVLVGALSGTADGLAGLTFTPIPLDAPPFCSGDGSLSTPCPCALPNVVPNPSGLANHGCANSFDLDGAELSAAGSVVPDTVQFTCVVGPSYAGFGFLVKGNGANFNGIASADGIRCVDGALVRFGGHNAGTGGAPSGSWTYPNTLQTTAVSVATGQAPAQAGYYQLFYRNAAANFCNASTANWSNGVQVQWP